MALRLLLSNRIIIPQRTSLIRFCRYYTPLSFEHRSINSLSSSNNSLRYCYPFKNNSQFLSTQPTYFLSFKCLSSSSPPSSSDNNSPPSSSDGNSSSSSSSSSSPPANDGKSSNNDDNRGNEPGDNTVPVVIQTGNPLMTMEVPENYPIVPLIPVSRHPLFPKFIKMLEITNKDLMDLIRRKVKLNQPYAGIFLRKESTTGEKSSTSDDKSFSTDSKINSETLKDKIPNPISSDVIKNLDEVYKIGSFVQIHEVHDMGDRLRMIVMAHRRIKIVGLASDDLGIEEIDRRRPQQKTNGNRRRQKRKGKIILMEKKKTKILFNIDEPMTAEEMSSESMSSSPPSPISDEPIVVNKILLVNTENVTHEPYEQTPELKV